MISALRNVPKNAQEWAIWSFAHRADTDEIVQAIAAQGGPRLPQYQLDPIPFFDVKNWLAREQQTHNGFTGALAQQGTDLQDVDFNDPKQLEAWIWLEVKQHEDARALLKI